MVVSVKYALKAIHNISRPGAVPAEGDTIEIECVGGFVKEVDAMTRSCKTTNQRFILGPDGALQITRHAAAVD